MRFTWNGFVHGLFGREVSEDELSTFLRLGGLAGSGECRRRRAMKITVSTLIDRPVAGVWRWYAVEHVRTVEWAR